MNNLCEQSFRVMAYHDGQLSPQEAQVVQSHLQLCKTCAADLTRWQTLSSRIQQAQRPQLSPSALALVRQTLCRGEDRSAFRLAWRLLVAASMIVVTSLLGLQVTPSSAQSGRHPWELDATWIQAGQQTEAVEYQTAQWIVTGLSVSQPQGNTHE